MGLSHFFVVWKIIRLEVLIGDEERLLDRYHPALGGEELT